MRISIHALFAGMLAWTRVPLDLTGLPPTVAEIDAFTGDSAPDAYERVVNRLLASPQFSVRSALNSRGTP